MGKSKSENGTKLQIKSLNSLKFYRSQLVLKKNTKTYNGIELKRGVQNNIFVNPPHEAVGHISIL